MPDLFHPEAQEISLSQVLYALSDPIRLQIFSKLFDLGEEVSCSYFNSLAKKSNLSHHYKVLREAGVIYVRIEGRHRYLSLRQSDINKRFPRLFPTIFNSYSQD
ncbi:ArsR/SmtB family transcription factor [Streptococcus sobrinus]|nr:helix-turn-helix transcriptional regulator [Streptococcus sobrinus]AWN18997.1 transcriptional regulator [Streptococcus sobrinus]AWN20691.1 transcriptional regulator [Streptococcus sobrinus]AWN61539.1 transcriptional regulator [Streptococcus sobrinus]AWN63411.1 transcriptional regulator [Streptococcus sobrinus]OZV23700.1 transcriptional regulator [Streptococcus sobrinus]